APHARTAPARTTTASASGQLRSVNSWSALPPYRQQRRALRGGRQLEVQAQFFAGGNAGIDRNAFDRDPGVALLPGGGDGQVVTAPQARRNLSLDAAQGERLLDVVRVDGPELRNSRLRRRVSEGEAAGLDDVVGHLGARQPDDHIVREAAAVGRCVERRASAAGYEVVDAVMLRCRLAVVDVLVAGEDRLHGIAAEEVLQLPAVADRRMAGARGRIDLRRGVELGVREEKDRPRALVRLQVGLQPGELVAGDRVLRARHVGVEGDEVGAAEVEGAVELAEMAAEGVLGAGRAADLVGRRGAGLPGVDLVVARGVVQRHGARQRPGGGGEGLVLLLQLVLGVAVAVDGVARPDHEVGPDQADL